jgi:uncharacterized protein YndB with AHSA1/START domain
MITVESSIVIARSVADVYAFVSDQTNEPMWHTDILEIRSADGSAAGLGSNWLVTVRFMGRKDYKMQVTGLDPNRRVELTTTAGWLQPTTIYLLEPANGSTRFTRRVDIPVDRALRIMKPLMQRMAVKRNAAFVKNLKQVLEA